MAWHGMAWHWGVKHSLNPARYSQLSSCMVHVWMSMGKFLRSMGQDRISVSLDKAEEGRGLLGAGAVGGKSCPTGGKRKDFPLHSGTAPEEKGPT